MWTVFSRRDEVAQALVSAVVPLSLSTDDWVTTLDAQRKLLRQQVPPSTIIQVSTNTMWFWQMSAPGINGQQEAMDYFNRMSGAFPDAGFAPPSKQQVQGLISGRGVKLGQDYLYKIGIHGFESHTGAPSWNPQYKYFPQHTLFTNEVAMFDAEGGCPAEYRTAIDLADGVEQRLPIGFKNQDVFAGIQQEVWGVKFLGQSDPNQAPR
jgi:hypothetical protein